MCVCVCVLKRNKVGIEFVVHVCQLLRMRRIWNTRLSRERTHGLFLLETYIGEVGHSLTKDGSYARSRMVSPSIPISHR